MCHLNAQAKMDISKTTQQLVQVCCYKRVQIKDVIRMQGASQHISLHLMSSSFLMLDECK